MFDRSRLCIRLKPNHAHLQTTHWIVDNDNGKLVIFEDPQYAVASRSELDELRSEIQDLQSQIKFLEELVYSKRGCRCEARNLTPLLARGSPGSQSSRYSTYSQRTSLVPSRASPFATPVTDAGEIIDAEHTFALPGSDLGMGNGPLTDAGIANKIVPVISGGERLSASDVSSAGSYSYSSALRRGLIPRNMTTSRLHPSVPSAIGQIPPETNLSRSSMNPTHPSYDHSTKPVYQRNTRTREALSLVHQKLSTTTCSSSPNASTRNLLEVPRINASTASGITSAPFAGSTRLRGQGVQIPHPVAPSSGRYETPRSFAQHVCLLVLLLDFGSWLNTRSLQVKGPFIQGN